MDHISKRPILRSDGSDGRKPGVFLPGTGRSPKAGKLAGNKGRIARLRELCAKWAKEFDCPADNPAELLAYIAMTGRDPLEDHVNKLMGAESPFAASKINKTLEDGTVVRVRGFVTLDTRVDCAVKVLPYMMPRLSRTEVTGDEGQPLFESDSEHAAKISRDPEVRRLFEAVAKRAAEVHDGEGGREDSE